MLAEEAAEQLGNASASVEERRLQRRVKPLKQVRAFSPRGRIFVSTTSISASCECASGSDSESIQFTLESC